jgi:hypothetical protein
MNNQRYRSFLCLLSSSCLIFVLGCGTNESRHEVQGKVVFAGGDIKALEGHAVEIAHSTDTTVRASGVIGPDGRFVLETLNDGKLQRGAKEGTYNARLVLTDEGDGKTKRLGIAPRYLNFQSTGWQVRVPTTGAVELTVTPK